MKNATVSSSKKKSLTVFAMFAVAVMLLPTASAFVIDDITIDTNSLPYSKTWDILDSGLVNMRFINIDNDMTLNIKFENVGSSVIGTNFSNYGMFESENSIFLIDISSSNNNEVLSFIANSGMSMTISEILKGGFVEGCDDCLLKGETYPGIADLSSIPEYSNAYESHEITLTIPDTSIPHSLSVISDEVISFFAVTEGKISLYDMMNDDNTPYEPAFPLLLPIGTSQVILRSMGSAYVEVQISTNIEQASSGITDLELEWLGMDNIRLTNDIAELEQPNIYVDSNNIIHTAWIDYRNSGSIYYKNKNYISEVWNSEIQITNGSYIPEELDFSGSDNNLYIVFKYPSSTSNYWEDRIMFMKSVDGGQTWTSPTSIGIGKSPSISTSGNHVYIAYQSTTTDPMDFNGNVGSQLHVLHSCNGTTWDDTTFYESAVYQTSIPIITANENYVHLVWAGSDDKLHYAYSDDYGVSWSATTSSYVEIECELSDYVMNEPFSIASQLDNLYIVWSDVRDGQEEIYYKKKDSSGWRADIKITSSNDSSLNPKITCLADDSSSQNIHLVWEEMAESGKKTIHYKGLEESGSDLTTKTMISNNIDSESSQPDIAIDYFNGIHIVWVDDRDGNQELYYSGSESPVLTIDSPILMDSAIEAGDPITIVTTIRNSGEVSAINIPVNFYSFPEENLFATVVIDEISPHSYESISAVWNSTAGSHDIVVTIDLDNTYSNGAIVSAST
ncbi:MAG: hypothetical protein KAR56_03880, partial [Thermoplasmata archaeon]|nr:hypothetical protein [Thermoplasmata archaeon]